MKKIALLPLLVFLFPVNAPDSINRPESPSEVLTLRATNRLQSFTAYREALTAAGHDLTDQGILVETVDGRARLAGHNADYAFSPASAMKLAASLAALTTFAPDHRYRTIFRAAGTLDRETGRLEGDLVVEGGADPMFSLAEAREAGLKLKELGIRRVTGALRIAGPFYYFARNYSSNLSLETSASKLRNALEQTSIGIEGPTVSGNAAGAELLTIYSRPLAEIILYMNAYSSNAVAEVLGESIGGREVIQNLLREQLKLRDIEAYVGYASGLRFNRLSPRASISILRELLKRLESHSLQPEDVMPIAGIDSGTLRDRFTGENLRGTIIAKTGTLTSTDNGVSTLVGIAYTRDMGPLLFAIFNSDGSVYGYRKLQDRFLDLLVEEKGGGLARPRANDAFAETGQAAADTR